MVEYLQNDICKFTPLFKLDATNKKNILSGSFFKMGSHYKDFTLYVNGLIEVNNFVKLNMNSYTVRVFIDRNIYNDRSIMSKIENLDHVELVLFECNEFKVGEFHVGLFATIVRFFPMFDFPNNDANIVLITDVDDPPRMDIIEYVRLLEKRGNLNDLYYVKLANINKNVFFGYPMFYHNRISSYAIARSFCGIKKIPNDFIPEFLYNVQNNKYEFYTNYEITDSKSKFGEQNKNFIYGIDEYLVNHAIVEYSIRNNLAYSNYTKYEIGGSLYFIVNYMVAKSDKSITKKQLESTKNIIKKLLESIGKRYNDKISINDNFRFLDRMVYNTDNSKVKFEVYKFMMDSYFDDEYKFLFPSDLYKFVLTQKYFGLYEFAEVQFFNTKIDDFFVKKKQFSNDQMDILYVKLNEILKKKKLNNSIEMHK